ncbi:hypothetical protein MMB75_05500 [Paenibacillus sp. P2(2022)]|uniref:Uncharacterized protein n=1 Tax=Paenibacillus polymyxa TaxID=1406 RepID=A0A378XYL5_PAEPO|nr:MULTISPECIES: hypothetical protein [Paenibacillus]AUS27050.1 hypothetical protein C1A50_2883 [Paenibacillus polymyxa]KJK30790.1 hypothetical protein TY89_11540 [Paenibacillus polymyxa]MBE7899870.1 hypothetical protein [Paenibacillus polymyxa]MBG9765343.1 hypothetical protein [Paenibacillus polymyxa]MCC3259110.1 hypothetical protein [Paenibacillus polymyxa]
MSSIGKIFSGLTGQTPRPIKEKNKVHENENLVIIFYDYKKSNSYLSVLNDANANGLRQLIFPPNRFSKVIKNLSELNFKVKNIEFDPPLNQEDQLSINKTLVEGIIEENFIKIHDEISFYNSEQDSIPKKLSFMSKNGNYYSLFNNGVISIEEEEDVGELNPFLTTLKGGGF